MPPLVLALVGGHLAGGGEGEAAAGADAVEVVGGLAVHAALILALLVLVELLEAVLGVGVVLDVVALVLLNVTLVLEGERAARAPGWDMGSLSWGQEALPHSHRGPRRDGLPAGKPGWTLGQGLCVALHTCTYALDEAGP